MSYARPVVSELEKRINFITLWLPTEELEVGQKIATYWRHCTYKFTLEDFSKLPDSVLDTVPKGSVFVNYGNNYTLVLGRYGLLKRKRFFGKDAPEDVKQILRKRGYEEDSKPPQKLKHLLQHVE